MIKILFLLFCSTAWVSDRAQFENIHISIYRVVFSTARCSKRTSLLGRIQSIHPVHPVQLIAFEQSKQFRTYQDRSGQVRGYQWVISGLSVGYQWIISGLSMGYQRAIRGFSEGYQRLSEVTDSVTDS